MDPLTQASLGAAAASAVSSRAQARWALLLGALAGAAPDLDVLIRSSADPLLGVEYHRHFSHALLCAPLIGLCVAALFKALFARAAPPFAACVRFALLGALTHGLLDACTGYGTRLYWPFSQCRESWNLISVIDPIFTLPLLAGTLWAFIGRRPRAAQWSLLLCTLYLGFCGWQQVRASRVAEQLALQRGHQPQCYSLRPSFGNSLLWRMIYAYEGRYYVDAVSLLPGAAPRLYPGRSVAQFVPDDAAADFSDNSVQGQDIERFRFFSQGYVYRHPRDPQVLGDVRYATWPDSVLPLWGIRLDPAAADAHVQWVTYRDGSPAARARLWQMILGRPVAPLGD
jgi:inner membrane protein